eukprot:4931042-Pyramimonas_sp.AAC.1
MDLILLAGTQATHRKCEQILSRRVHGRLILGAEVADGLYTNKYVGCAVILHRSFTEAHIR